ncbi:MAG: hypothetical protein GY842_06600, partial [bacterium]|nr:hypothetical protein [bacterium]
VPDYIDAVPEKDGWGHPYQFALDENLHGQFLLGIRSTGDDGRFEGHGYEIGGFVDEEFDRDLVWCDGYFVRWPEAKKAGR